MLYTHTKVKDLIDRILKSFGDTNGVTFLREEVRLGISEGLQIIDSIAYINRDITKFKLPTETSFVDLLSISELNDSLAFDKDIDEMKFELNRHLLEDEDSLATTLGTVFDTSLYDFFIEKKTIEFLIETGILLNVSSIDLGLPPISVLELNSDILNVRRLSAFIDNKYTNVVQESEENIKAFYSLDSINSANPCYFSLTTQPRNILRFYPKISNTGQLRLLSIKKPSIQTTIPIPTNLSWAIKYGVLYEYYRLEGDGKDEKRAEYCKNRWQQGINIARDYFSVLEIRLEGIPASFDSIANLDYFNSNWENDVVSSTNDIRSLGISFASWNLIALHKKLDAGLDIDVELEFLRNAILPETEDDYVQIPYELLNILTAYVHHYLLLKFGGPLFFNTIEKVSSLLQSLVKENARLNTRGNEFALVPYKTIMRQKAQSPIEADRYEVVNQNG